jgi:prevent-host-death family protein
MATPRRTTATAAEVARKFSHYSDVALAEPVIVTKNGRARNVLISMEEYERLKERDQIAFFAEDTPERFVAALEAIIREDEDSH